VNSTKSVITVARRARNRTLDGSGMFLVTLPGVRSDPRTRRPGV
jgi:hypothetical protein